MRFAHHNIIISSKSGEMDWASHCWEAGGGRQDSLTSGLCIDSSKGDYMMIAHLKYQTAQILNVTLHAGWRYR